MPKADKVEKEETLNALTVRIFDAMLEELVVDMALHSHHEVARGRAVCAVCNSRCGSIHTPGSAAIAAASANNEFLQVPAPGTRADTPSSAGPYDGPGKGLASGTGTSTPTSTKGDGNLYYDCASCGRTIAFNRYAPHLSSCMGLSTSRRGAFRASVKPKLPSEAGRSVSPMSDGGNMSDEKTNSKAKGKAKGKKAADEGDFTLKRKRPDSPQISPNKKAKKGKASGSPVSRVKADTDLSGLPTNSHFSPSTNSHSKIPSKLRDSSTTSLLERSSASSRDSSPEDAYAATPASSFSSQSPIRPLVGNGKSSRGRPLVLGTGPPKRPSPPRPQPVHMPDYHIEIDHANETGSSTDTDSE